MKILYVSIAITVLLVGFSIYFWQENQDLRTQLSSLESNRTALNLCVESLTASNDMISNCGAAYIELGKCITRPASCDAEQTTAKLQQLNREKDDINLKFQEFGKQLKLLLPQ